MIISLIILICPVQMLSWRIRVRLLFILFVITCTSLSDPEGSRCCCFFVFVSCFLVLPIAHAHSYVVSHDPEGSGSCCFVLLCPALLLPIVQVHSYFLDSISERIWNLRKADFSVNDRNRELDRTALWHLPVPARGLAGKCRIPANEFSLDPI